MKFFDFYFFRKKNKALLSVIIPNFNNEEYIGECLDSVLSQTYKNIEIVVVDDCSTDNSTNIIMDYEKKCSNITVLWNESNKGVSFSRDFAIKYSKGDFITTLDSDDFFYDKEKLEKEMDIINSHKQNVIAFSDILLTDEFGKKKVLSSEVKPIKEGNILSDILSRECMIPRDFLMKRECYFEVGGYNTSINLYEDWDLKIRLAAKFEYYFSNTIGVGYRRHGKGLSAVAYPNHAIALKNILNKNIYLIEDKNEKQKILKIMDIKIKQFKEVTT